MQCPNCKARNDEDSAFCAECGERLPKQKEQPRQSGGNKFLSVVGAITLIVLAIIFLAYVFSPKPHPCDNCRPDQICLEGTCQDTPNPCDYCTPEEVCLNSLCYPKSNVDPCSICAADETCINQVCVKNGNPSNEPTLLFYDDFSEGIQPSKWVFFGHEPKYLTGIGNPAPSAGILAVDWQKEPTTVTQALDGPSTSTGGPGRAFDWIPTLRTGVNPFISTAGLSFQMEVSMPLDSLDKKDLGTFMVGIRDQSDDTKSPAAYAIFSPNLGYTSFFIYKGDKGVIDTESPPLRDSKYHSVAFTMDPYGNAGWFLDGVQQLSTTGFPNGQYLLEIFGNPKDFIERPSHITQRVYYSVDNVYVHSLNME